MNDIDRLRELVKILADMPGDGAALVAPHIEPHVIRNYAHLCSRVILMSSLGVEPHSVSQEEMTEMLEATYLSAFILGCAWATMKVGSGEK